MTATPRDLSCQRIASVRSCFLSCAASDFMTGQTVNVDGGKAMH
jgi:hypothetical protein